MIKCYCACIDRYGTSKGRGGFRNRRISGLEAAIRANNDAVTTASPSVATGYVLDDETTGGQTISVVAADASAAEAGSESGPLTANTRFRTMENSR